MSFPLISHKSPWFPMTSGRGPGQAEPLYRRVLVSHETHLGPSHNVAWLQAPENPCAIRTQNLGFSEKKIGENTIQKHHQNDGNFDGKMMIHRFMGKAYFQSHLVDLAESSPVQDGRLGGKIPCLVTSRIWTFFGITTHVRMEDP